MNKSTKYIICIALFGIFGLLILQALNWQSPAVNWNSDKSTYDCLQQDENTLRFQLKDEQGIDFDIEFVSNTQADCLNPYFPAIHIKTETPHNAWVQLIYTDSQVNNEKLFIDAEKELNQNSPYPFYTYTKDFYDAPLWSYSLLNKPLSYWKAHAFAVEINHDNKTIKSLGGIEWGFALHFIRLRPVAIMPHLLDKDAWEEAWGILREKLPEYNVITDN